MKLTYNPVNKIINRTRCYEHLSFKSENNPYYKNPIINNNMVHRVSFKTWLYFSGNIGNIGGIDAFRYFNIFPGTPSDNWKQDQWKPVYAVDYDIQVKRLTNNENQLQTR